MRPRGHVCPDCGLWREADAFLLRRGRYASSCRWCRRAYATTVDPQVQARDRVRSGALRESFTRQARAEERRHKH